MMAGQNQVAEYKGRKYRLLWIGDTKYGRRAHLQFFNGSKDFWVDAALVSITTDSAGNRRAPGRGEHVCRNGHEPHSGPCCTGRHGVGYDCGADCCELD